jgi:hypothetical protein
MAAVDSSIGALELGVFFSTVLYGVTTLQTFLYTEANFKDALWLRITVSESTDFFTWSLPHQLSGV